MLERKKLDALYVKGEKKAVDNCKKAYRERVDRKLTIAFGDEIELFIDDNGNKWERDAQRESSNSRIKGIEMYASYLDGSKAMNFSNAILVSTERLVVTDKASKITMDGFNLLLNEYGLKVESSVIKPCGKMDFNELKDVFINKFCAVYRIDGVIRVPEDYLYAAVQNIYDEKVAKHKDALIKNCYEIVEK